MSPGGSRIADDVMTALARAKVPGCSVALVDAEGVWWSGGFGLADVRSRTPAEPDTGYHLFSGTKLFTAVAVLQLAERGLLELEEPVARVLDDVGVPADITILHLLSHRSGLREDVKGLLGVVLADEALPSSAEALARYRIRRKSAPGEKVEYCNINYALLGELVTRVSGREYRDHVTDDILRPLEMNVGFAYSDAMRRHAATGTIERFDPMRLALWWLTPETRGRIYDERVGKLVALREFQLATPAIGGLVGTVPDFALFLRAQLAGGGPVLRPESVRRMQSLVAKGAAGIESRFGVGLGWKHGRVDGRAFLNHEGGGAGFTSELRIYPDAGIGVALAMNGMRMPRTMRVAHRICEAVYGAREALRAEGSPVTVR